MKKAFLVLAVAACAVFFTACPGPVEKTKAELLASPKKGWILSAAESSPAYHMASGEYVSNLMNGYLYDYELDDIMTFTVEGVQTLDPGANIDPEGQGLQEAKTFLYSFDAADDDWMYMQVPFILDANDQIKQVYCHILNLTEEEFKFNCTIDDVAAQTKDQYTFTLTYVPAK
ncbi:MAG: hypothetical protein II856_00970 [Bacteroidales bacterium]|nr:hypothetical protein [Bacteroidales bacterium]